MPASTLLPKLLFGVAAAVGLILGLTTYTFPIVGHVRDDDVLAVIHRALGDTAPSLPAPPSSLTSQRDVRPAGPFGDLFDRDTSGAAPEPVAWATRAAAMDSSALREWLDRSGLFTGSSTGRARTTTLWRLTTHPGCPLLSRLSAVTMIATKQLVEISSDCPRTDVGVEGNGTP
jgi:hypothetical protein